MGALVHRTNAVVFNNQLSNNPKDQVELRQTYEELFFALPEKKKERAQKTWKAAQKNPAALNQTSDTLYVTLKEIDLDSAENQLVFINLINTHSQVRDFFIQDVFGKSMDTVSEIPLTVSHPNLFNDNPTLKFEDLSDDVLKMHLGLQEFDIFNQNREEWVKNNETKIHHILVQIQTSDAINFDKQQAKKYLLNKFTNDPTFAYNFFSRWNITHENQILSPKTLKMLALKNPGAALGILLNPKLRSALLTQQFNEEEIFDLLHNAASQTDPRHQHYFPMTLDLLLTHAKKQSITNTVKRNINSTETQNNIRDIMLSPTFRPDVGRVLEKHFSFFVALADNSEGFHLSELVFQTTSPVNLLKKLLIHASQTQNTRLLNTITEQAGTIIATFADRKSKGEYKNSTLDEMIEIMRLPVGNLINRYATYQTEHQAKQIELLFNNPEIAQKLNLSEDNLKFLASKSKNQKEKSQDFADAYNQELWDKKYRANQKGVVKRILNSLFGLFEKEFQEARRQFAKGVTIELDFEPQAQAQQATSKKFSDRQKELNKHTGILYGLTSEHYQQQSLVPNKITDLETAISADKAKQKNMQIIVHPNPPLELELNPAVAEQLEKTAIPQSDLPAWKEEAPKKAKVVDTAERNKDYSNWQMAEWQPQKLDQKRRQDADNLLSKRLGTPAPKAERRSLNPFKIFEFLLAKISDSFKQKSTPKEEADRIRTKRKLYSEGKTQLEGDLSQIEQKVKQTQQTSVVKSVETDPHQFSQQRKGTNEIRFGNPKVKISPKDLDSAKISNLETAISADKAKQKNMQIIVHPNPPKPIPTEVEINPVLAKQLQETPIPRSDLPAWKETKVVDMTDPNKDYSDYQIIVRPETKEFKGDASILHKEIRDDVSILEEEIKDDVSVLDDELRDDVSVLADEIKDDESVLDDELRDDVSVLADEIKDDESVLDDELRDDVSVLADEIRDDESVLEEEIKDDVFEKEIFQNKPASPQLDALQTHNSASKVAARLAKMPLSPPVDERQISTLSPNKEKAKRNLFGGSDENTENAQPISVKPQFSLSPKKQNYANKIAEEQLRSPIKSPRKGVTTES